MGNFAGKVTSGGMTSGVPRIAGCDGESGGSPAAAILRRSGNKLSAWMSTDYRFPYFKTEKTPEAVGSDCVYCRRR